MVEKIEGGNAKVKISLAPEAEAFLRSEIRVEERWALRIREDILTVLTAVDARQAEAGSVDVLVGGKDVYKRQVRSLVLAQMNPQ